MSAAPETEQAVYAWVYQSVPSALRGWSEDYRDHLVKAAERAGCVNIQLARSGTVSVAVSYQEEKREPEPETLWERVRGFLRRWRYE